MSNESNPFKNTDGLNDGVTLFATEDWINLMVFFRDAAYHSPSSESTMRLRLGMQSQDEISPEIGKSIRDFQVIEGISKDFLGNTVNQVLGLADAIKHYEIEAVTVYDRLTQLIDHYDLGFDTETDTQRKLDELIRLWQAGAENGMSEKIKSRIKSLVARLAAQAAAYGEQAETLYKSIGDTSGSSDSYYQRLTNCVAEFEADAQAFEKKYGEESKDVKDFKAKVEKLQADLKKLRKKESDEVIVLSSSPAYLLIPFFGPVILAGVDIGVGIDLAHVRAEIKSKVEESELIQGKLDVASRFVTYYTNGKTLVEAIAKSIKDILPKLDTLGRSWRAISADLTRIAQSLNEDGASQIDGEDWNNLVATLETAKRGWIEIGTKADRFRSFAQPEVATSVEDLLKKAMAA